MCDAFDTYNDDNSAVHRREATRLVSCSQPGSGSWLARAPDHTLAHSKVASPYYLVQLQQRLGLYLSSLAPYLSATASQHERLGDAALNDMNESARHNSALRCVFDALNALTMPNQPPHALRLCDRGDGTPAGKATARQTYAHINSGHVPDMIRHGAPPEAHEFKCVTPHVQGPLRGQGTVQHGGCPSQADGGDYAFGATEENLIKKNTGLRERGKPSDGPYDRKTGLGWVASTAKHVNAKGEPAPHDYADAQKKGHRVFLFITESYGGMAARLFATMRHLHKCATTPGVVDSTRYGQGRASPRSFLAHHAAALSSAIVFANADNILARAVSMSIALTRATPRGAGA